MVIPVAAINIPTNTKIATLVPWYRAMAAAHAIENHPWMLKENDIKKENAITTFVQITRGVEMFAVEYSETYQKLNVTNGNF